VRDAFDLAVEFGHHAARIGSARERVAVRAMRRREDVTVCHRPADADGDGLLADRDVQESGQLARTEAFLDALLEPADEEHVVQELPQCLLADGAFVLDLGQSVGSVRSPS